MKKRMLLTLVVDTTELSNQEADDLRLAMEVQVEDTKAKLICSRESWTPENILEFSIATVFSAFILAFGILTIIALFK